MFTGPNRVLAKTGSPATSSGARGGGSALVIPTSAVVTTVAVESLMEVGLSLISMALGISLTILGPR